MANRMPPSAKLLALLIAMSLIAWSIVAWVHIGPWLARRPRRDALLVAMTPQMFRHIGALALFPGIGTPPPEWSVPLAWGDGTTAILAMLAMIALQRSWRFAVTLAWLANLFGVLDLLHNATKAALLQIAPQLGPIAFVVAFGVPAMLVAHTLAFRILLRES